MKFNKTLREIAEILEGNLIGSPDIIITGVRGIEEANESEISFLANPRYASLINTTRAAAVITSFDVKEATKPIIQTNNPSLAFAKLVSLIYPSSLAHPKNIHNSVLLGKNVVLGKDIGIGAYSVIENGVEIGNNSVIYPGCYIGHNTKIGKNSIIYSNVTIREDILIGNNVIIHSGTVIGADGFGYVNVGGVHHRIPQVGTVVIEDDVDIGANVTIDRARFDKTIIGRGTKIDNLVQIAHNVIIGENSIIIAQAGISGSTKIGNNVIIAGQAGLVGHIEVGDNAILAAQAGITKSVPSNTKVSGYPARPHNIALRVDACVQKLPEAYKKIEDLEKRLKALEDNPPLGK
ncbi:MAG: UDP-3-O-(3-hydroxymyristoyl)glucosamine N-acyltransferase [Candidatus Omnitrophota bacterium]